MKQVYTFAELASLFHVSPTSIRNWVRAGYLVQASPEPCTGTRKKIHAVTAESVAAFQQDMLGFVKLRSRANKRYRSSHDHAALSAAILSSVWQNIHDSQHGDALGIAYEQALSNQYKNAEGVYYTPSALCADMLQEVPSHGKHSAPEAQAALLFCDPCCGSGNFLLAALQRGFAPEHIYGYDIDPVAVEISRRRLFDRTGIRSNTLFCADFGEEYAQQRVPAGYFDCIFTNPPWGKKLPRAHRQEWARKAGLHKAVDSSGLFWLLACMAVKEGGYIGLLMQEAFFQVGHFQELRRHALQKQILRCIDYGKAFSGLMSKARALIVRNSPAAAAQEGVLCRSPQGQSLRTQQSFYANPHTIYNISTTAEEQAIIAHMRSLPHIYLQQGVRWGLGIVTGNNKRWLSSSPAAGHVPVYKGSDIQAHGLKPPSCYIPADLSLYQQVAPRAMYIAPAKILYRFISTRLVFFYDTEQRFILNSANMLILEPSFPLSMPILTDFLNTSIINWFYTKLFESPKVLRSNLEYIPIYTDFLHAASAQSGHTGQSGAAHGATLHEADLLAYLGLKAMPNGGYRLA